MECHNCGWAATSFRPLCRAGARQKDTARVACHVSNAQGMMTACDWTGMATTPGAINWLTTDPNNVSIVTMDACSKALDELRLLHMLFCMLETSFRCSTPLIAPPKHCPSLGIDNAHAYLFRTPLATFAASCATGN